MARLAFAADLHVDAYGSRIDPATGLNARLLDYLRTTRWVAAKAEHEGAQALIVAGDFTERRHPAPWLVSRIRSELAFGPATQVFLRGNHDGEIGGGSIVSVLDDGYDHSDVGYEGRIGVARPMLVPIASDAVVAAMPFLDRHWLRAQPGFEGVPDAELYRLLGEQWMAIARGLYAEARRDYPDAGVVLVCHQALSGAAMSDSQRAFLGDVSLVVDSGAVAEIGFEAVVAGHLHRHQVVAAGDRPVLYAGSIERVDFGEEGETKGFVVADVGPGRFDWQLIETPARPYATVDYSGGPVPDVEDAIVRAINVEPGVPDDEVVLGLEHMGAWDVVEVRHVRPELMVAEGAIAESTTPVEALTEYFAADPAREVLVERGRELLAEVA